MATQLPSAAFRSQEQDMDVFQLLEDYAWDSDPEFQSGLQAILGSNPSAEQSEHLTLRAKCFYFSRKNKTSIDFDTYQTWRSRHSYSRPTRAPVVSSQFSSSSIGNGLLRPETSSRNIMATTPGNIEATAPYPTSFSQIVELITSGDPIPGIKEVPNTVMEGQASEPTTAKRKKPWEKDDATAGEEFVEATSSVVDVA